MVVADASIGERRGKLLIAMALFSSTMWGVAR